MNDWFDWNGVRCTENGMHVLSQPSIVMAKERVEHIDIPGLSGSLTRTEGSNVYSDKNLSCVCIVDKPHELVDEPPVSRIQKICGWLKGGGNVTFANQPEGYFKARIANQISFDQIVRGNPHRSFSVEFRCKPFMYLHSGDIPFVCTSEKLFFNPGNVPAAPVLKITGTGQGTIMSNGSTMLIDGLNEIGYIILDCEAKIAYKGAPGDPSDPLKLLGTRVTGEWLTLPAGDSFISFSGGIETVTVTPRWRCV